MSAVADSPLALPRGQRRDAGAPWRSRSRRDWLVDITFVAVSTLSLISYLQVPQRGGPGLLIAVNVAAGVLLWWRRPWPVPVAAGLLLLGTFSQGSRVACLLAVLTVAVHCRRPVAVAVSVAHVATVVPYLLVNGVRDITFFSFVLVGLLTAVMLTWGMSVRAQRQLVTSWRDRAEEAEAQRELREQQTRHLERTRIAREMHDVLAHRISLLSMHAGALQYRPDAPPEQLAAAAGIVQANAHQALEDLREVIGVLRDEAAGPPRPPQPTLTDLPRLIDESRQAGTRVDVTDERPTDQDPPTSTGRTAYRIVQEALTNARKHAPGTTISIRVHGRPGDGLSIDVANPAPLGAAPTRIPGSRSGLIGLTERVTLADGRLAHGPTPTGGFALQAWLPWPT